MPDIGVAPLLLGKSNNPGPPLIAALIARHVLVRCVEQNGNENPSGVPRKTEKDAQSSTLILLQSLNALGSLKIMKLGFVGSGECIPHEAEAALRQCISTFQEIGSEYSISDFPQVKAEYLSCLKRLDYLYLTRKEMAGQVRMAKEIKREIQRVQNELSNAKKT
ncbi:hypothetical protein OROGR_008191 [Orobanche gracilis]